MSTIRLVNELFSLSNEILIIWHFSAQILRQSYEYLRKFKLRKLFIEILSRRI
ncbi:MAG: hypothetical protein IKZ58_09115 [Selenomonadaceae bacterium]|nr:hypothetical protein [Selenomonadaceae bacterium]